MNDRKINSDKKEKILLIVPSLARGGAERLVSLISKKLMAYYNVIVITYMQRDGYEIGGEHICLNTENNGNICRIINVFRRSYKIRKIVKEEKPKKTISFVGNVSPILSLKKVVPSIHNNPSYYPSSEKFFLSTIYKMPNVEKVITVSNGISEHLSTSFNLKNVNVIYNPVDDEEIDSKICEKKPIEGEYIIGVGRLHKQKRFDLLIKAYSISKLKGKVKLVILGEGPLKEELQRLIDNLELEKDVLLIGLQINPYIYMKHSKYLVLTSDHEGFPLVLIEALYCGTPVISVNCNYGPNEVIINNYNGILLPDNQVDTISKAMDKLYEEQNLCEELSYNARISVEKFKLSSIIFDWIKLIEG